MVEPSTGKPTPFFMRWWQEQIDTNAIIPSLQTPAEVSAVLDILGTAAHGDVLFRGATLWEYLPAGTIGNALITQGAGADPIWGSVSATWLDLTDTPNSYVGETGKIAHVNAGETAIELESISEILDAEAGSTHGQILYRNGTVWTVLAPGTSGYLLQTNGAAANPSWVVAPTGTTVFTGLTDTPANYTGDADKIAMVNTGETALEFRTVSDMLEEVGATQGQIMYYNGTAWTVLAPGTAGQVLETNGAGANPSWETASGGGGSGDPGAGYEEDVVFDQDFNTTSAAEVYIPLSDEYDYFMISRFKSGSGGASGYYALSTDGGSTYDDAAADYVRAWMSAASDGTTGGTASTGVYMFSAASEAFWMLRGHKSANWPTTLQGQNGLSSTAVQMETVIAQGTSDVHDYMRIKGNGGSMTSGRLIVIGVKITGRTLTLDSPQAATDETNNRLIATSYENTSGYPMTVSAVIGRISSTAQNESKAEISVDGTTWVTAGLSTTNIGAHTQTAAAGVLNNAHIQFFVPKDYHYRLTIATGDANLIVKHWIEQIQGGGGGKRPTTETVTLTGDKEIEIPDNCTRVVGVVTLDCAANTGDIVMDMMDALAGTENTYTCHSYASSVGATYVAAATAMTYTDNAASETGSERGIRFTIENPRDDAVKTTFETAQYGRSDEVRRLGFCITTQDDKVIKIHAFASSISSGTVYLTYYYN